MTLKKIVFVSAALLLELATKRSFLTEMCKQIKNVRTIKYIAYFV